MNIELHQVFYRDRIAVMYYNKRDGKGTYDIENPSDRERARKKLTADKNIDGSLMDSIVDEVAKAQKKLNSKCG